VDLVEEAPVVAAPLVIGIDTKGFSNGNCYLACADCFGRRFCRVVSDQE
jgi:hypothetical protein